ncbi:uncharacterized [Tachysurus ichikawai]
MLIVTETYRRVRVSTVESILTNSTGSLIGGNLQGLDLGENLNLKHSHLSSERATDPAFTTDLKQIRGHRVDLVFCTKEPAGIPERASGIQPCDSVSWKPPAKLLCLQHRTVYSAVHL